MPVFFLFLVTFPKNKAKIVGRYMSTSLWKIFFDSFCIFGVVTHFEAEKEFFYYALNYSIEYNSWDLNIFFMVLLMIEPKVDTKFQLYVSFSRCKTLHFFHNWMTAEL